MTVCRCHVRYGQHEWVREPYLFGADDFQQVKALHLYLRVIAPLEKSSESTENASQSRSVYSPGFYSDSSVSVNVT
jgi:hypothetical protein